jgi:hypothetical protein
MRMNGAYGSKAGKVAAIAIAAVSLSLFSTAAWLLWLDGELAFAPLAVAAICALMVAVPVTLFILAQVDKLHLADADLAEARRQLLAIHRELMAAQPLMEEADQTAPVPARVEENPSIALGGPLQAAA